MTTTSFDIAVRTLECCRCGGPIAAPLAGGRTSCRYCGTENVIGQRARTTERRAPSLGDEVARRSRLQVQIDHPVPGSPYDIMRAPRGLPPGDEQHPDRVRKAWNAAKAGAPGARLPQEQRELLWLALRLTGLEHRAGNALASRAVLETALDALPDAGHRQIVLCRMVVEAVREGDLAAAEGWLAECDPAPEVLEVDGAHREAQAWLARGKRDPRGVLAVLGNAAPELPTAPAFRIALCALRADALESLGQHEAAQQELMAASKGGDEAAALARVAVLGLAPRTLAQARRAQMHALARTRDALPFGLAALGGSLVGAPLLALLLLLAVTMPRCFFDADPFLGAHGYVLCPEACAGCRGPLRVYTDWHHDGGEHSTNGPQYFCTTPTNRVATMSSSEMGAQLSALAPYELSWSPAAATYITLVLLLLPFAFLRSVRVHSRAQLQAEGLDAEMSALARILGEAPPDRIPRRGLQGIGYGLMALAVALLVPTAIIGLELMLR